MPLLMEEKFRLAASVLVALATMAVKGFVIPSLLRRALRAANIDREVEPLIGFVPSLLLGAAATIGAAALARILPLLPEHARSLLVPGALATVLMRFHSAHRPRQGHFAGVRLFDFGKRHLSVRPAAHQFDAAAGGGGNPAGPHRGVFVIGIIVDRIQREFDSLDTRKLTSLARMKELLAHRRAARWRAALAAAWPNNRTRPWLLPVAGGLHAVLALWLLIDPPEIAADAWFGFDPLARAVLPVVSLLFLVCAIYGVVLFADPRGTDQPRFRRRAAGDARLVEPGHSGAAPRPALDRGGGDHAGDRAAAAFQRHAARVRGDVEISARRRHGHRAVVARFVLPRLRLAARRRQRRSDVHRAGRARRGVCRGRGC